MTIPGHAPLRALCCALVLSILAITPAAATKRVALVIGNGDYAHTGTLSNPKNDAADIAVKLEALGFDVTSAVNLNAAEFDATYAAFDKKLQDADVSLLFYAGHGMQFKGENYLIPVDARLESEATIQREAFPVTRFVSLMENRTPLNLVFLDACRDNPLAKRLFRSMSRTRSTPLTQGLGPIKRPTSETLMVYATAPNDVAADGDGRNSPFTQALLQHMQTPDVEVEVMLKRVTRTVLTNTQKRQKPERLSQLTREFYFNKRPTPTETAALQKNALEEQIREFEKRLQANAASRPFRPKPAASLRPQIAAAVTPVLPEIIEIPGGSFRMGCVSGVNCRRDEKPVRKVTVGSFGIARHETTFAQWDACVADGGCRPISDDEGWGRGNRPVINVSWNDAVAFTTWLSRKTGQRWRLPTEAEWEFAARAGTQTPFAFGNALTDQQANINAQGGGTKPVGQFQPNALGLHDMHGNVWEWVADNYAGNYYRSGPKLDPKGPQTGAKRVNRGGGWHYGAMMSRSAMRSGQTADSTRSNVGFRVARD